MKSLKLLLLYLPVLLLFANSCKQTATDHALLPVVPEGAQALSLAGDPLYSTEASPAILESYENAKQADLSIPENLIWYGRWTAYKGDYRGAILVFSEGIDQFPDDARFYRHRGHRYITIRDFDRAIEDFEKAAGLMQDQPDETEPDGMPNAMNIPVSTLKSNIYYHLGLAYYLKKQFPDAEKAFRNCIRLHTNEDNLVSATHWLYMILRLQGKTQDAWEAVEAIHPEMNVIENMAYHQLCLLYKGQKNISDFVSRDYSGIMNDAVAYGIGNYYKYNGSPNKAEEVFHRIIDGSNWASFGFIAAEAEIFGTENPL